VSSDKPLQVVSARGCDRSCWKGRCRAGIDFSSWPIAYIHAGEPTEAEFDERMVAMDEMLARRQPFACILVMNTAAKFNGEHRRRVAKWNTDNAEQLKLYCRGFAMVFHDSPVLRFMIGSMLMIIRQPVTYEVFGDEAAALAWARRRLTVSNRPPPR
jgi:hypothetical protein